LHKWEFFFLEQKKKEQSPSFQYREREKKQLELMEEQREKAEKAYFDITRNGADAKIFCARLQSF
jgi:hypothetical protein